ncbi:LytTR family DNA-binding domain-containing protein [Spirosoma montaniterrae]|uniref:HTH LytTR-type domain-containing protein n=1 Tax=Spirosoma montaniterrae TaxID=1178516 RepID=A0A1P9WXA5_9BACT|nr:LytTR family DNA-binding domain-containing protein [Spirosoma montaniterrae]AQG79999.1 hypothetical protein AWR27_12070 [Spirosoma montaniterrae]
MTTLKVPGIYTPLPVELIVWIQGDENYVRMHLINGRYHTLTRTLKWFDIQLPQFVRLHKSTLVNPAYVTHLNWAGSRNVKAVLRTGVVLRISRRRIRSVATQLQQGVIV